MASASVHYVATQNGSTLGSNTLTFAPDQTLGLISLSLSTTAGCRCRHAEHRLGRGHYRPCTVTATVERLPNSQTPMTGDESYTGDENATLVAGPGLDQPGLLDNVYDLDGDRLHVTQFTWNGPTTTVPSGGTGTATTTSGATLSVSANGGSAIRLRPALPAAIPLPTRLPTVRLRPRAAPSV